MAAVTDSSLLIRSRAGDRHAFGELVVRHYLAAYRTARAIMRSHLDAEDAVQDAFVRAYTQLNSFRGDAAFSTWLITIVRNQALSRLRAQRRRNQTMPPADAVLIGQVASVDPSPEDQLLDGERRHRLSRCIDALPARLREAMRLAQSGRHSYKEMSAMLGAPTGTIKSRVWEARRLVAGQLR